jgi:hypothetical protein
MTAGPKVVANVVVLPKTPSVLLPKAAAATK